MRITIIKNPKMSHLSRKWAIQVEKSQNRSFRLKNPKWHNKFDNRSFWSYHAKVLNFGQLVGYKLEFSFGSELDDDKI